MWENPATFDGMENVFGKRRDNEGLWEIFDKRTGEVVILDGGYPLSELDDRDVAEAWELLLAGELVPDDETPGPVR